MYWLTLIMVFILQWNARSLLANGLELKQFIKEMKQKPDIVCIQETWLKSNLDFVVNGYNVHRKDRSYGGGGGCMMLVRQGISYRVLENGDEQECIQTWTRLSVPFH